MDSVGCFGLDKLGHIYIYGTANQMSQFKEPIANKFSI